MTLLWIEDFLPEGYVRKRMFGGYAYYLDEKLVVLLFESEGSKTYRGQRFDFELWNGCMFPVEKENQEQVRDRFPFLINHPILPKWFYIPLESEDFESRVETILKEIRRRNPVFGSIPKPKKSKSPVRSSKSKPEEEIIDTRRPRMFSDEPREDRLKKAKKISDLKNLGPEAEKAFFKAGIKTAQQLIQMGWKKAMIQICKADSKNNHSVFAYAVIGALQNKEWSRIPDEDKLAARELMKSLREKAAAEKEKMPKKRKAKRSSTKKTRRKR